MQVFFSLFLSLAAVALYAQTAIDLPKPDTEGGKPLMAALQARASAREFSPRKLDSKVLSNLLWAACGINRPDGRRTAPTAHNRQEIDVYVALDEGLYLYDPKRTSCCRSRRATTAPRRARRTTWARRR